MSIDWGAVKWGTSVAVLVGGIIWSVAHKESALAQISETVTRHDRDIERLRADVRTTDSYLRDVAHKLDLFMCSQDYRFCGGDK